MFVKTLQPNISKELAIKLVEDSFDLNEPKVLNSLPSYLDQCFLIEDSQGQRFKLKIANLDESKDALMMQNAVKEHLHRNGFGKWIPKVILTKNGDGLGVLQTDEGQFKVRLVTYIEGDILVNTKPLRPDLLKEIGSMLGKMDKLLEDFDYPAAKRYCQWDLQIGAKLIRENLHELQTEEESYLVAYFLERYQKHTASLHQSLRTSIIHADANDYNMLVKPDEVTFGKLKFGGILDFGDMVHTQTINELAIAIAYIMENSITPIQSAIPVVKGYHEAYPLTEAEIKCLFDLACLRLCQTLVIGNFRKKLEENEYREERQNVHRRVLKELKNIPPEYAEAHFRNACGFSNNADSLEWIKNNQGAFGRVTPFDFSKDKYLVFDLSIGTEELAHLNWEDRKAVSEHLVNRIKSENAVVGITRYDEARLFFYADKFCLPNSDYDEYRNVHLGVDIIMEAGTSVYAALDGVVHHITQNDTEKDLKNAVILKHNPQEDIQFFTIYGNIQTALQIGQTVKKGEQIGNLVFIENWSPHLHFQVALKMLGFDENFPVTAPAEKTKRDFCTKICPNPNLILGLPESELLNTHYTVEEVIEKRVRLFAKSQKFYYAEPMQLVRSKAQWFYDDTGRKYLDSLNNVTHVGHCHPKVVEAISKQTRILNTNTRHLYSKLVEYAERVTATLPDPLSVCFFVCTGSEANDLALRLARHYSGSQETLVLDGAYHGNTTAVEQISPNRFDGPGGKGAMPFIHKVPQPNLYRGLYQYGDDNAGEKYAGEVKKIINRIESEGKKVGCMIAESLMGTSGQIVMPEGFLKKSFEYVRAAGGLCIIDEVQVGFGRTGHWWCFQEQDIIPDIVVMGKPIANGMPFGLVVTTPEIADAYNTGMRFFNTFGGNPVNCAAALAVMDVMEEENLMQHSLETGSYFINRLKEMMDEHEIIGDVRGQGLYLGPEFVKDRSTKEPAKAETLYIVERLRDKGILNFTNGTLGNCLKIKPPLVFDKKNVDYFINELDSILSESFFKNKYYQTIDYQLNIREHAKGTGWFTG